MRKQKNAVLDKTFNIAKENYHKRLNGKIMKTSWEVKFKLFNNLEINNKLKIKNKSIIRNYSLSFHSKEKKEFKKTFLTCYLDVKLFYLLLTRRIPWNMPISGSFIMYKRKPNFFDPNLTFSLNYLTI